MLAPRKWLPLCALMFMACGFEGTPPSGTAEDGDDGAADGSDTPDAPDEPTGTTPDSGDDILNLAPGNEALGTTDLTLGGAPVTIDTSIPAIVGVTLATGQLEVVHADGTGGELALLHVRDLAIQGTVNVTGARPLVIVSNTTSISAQITVTAHASGGGGGDHNVLTSNRGGAIEIYGKQMIALSSSLTAGMNGDAGAIVLQSAAINYATGTLSAGNNGDHRFAPGGPGNGRIYLRYKDTLTSGTASPKPDARKYD